MEYELEKAYREEADSLRAALTKAEAERDEARAGYARRGAGLNEAWAEIERLTRELSDANIALGRAQGRAEEMRAALVEYAEAFDAWQSGPRPREQDGYERVEAADATLRDLGRRLRDGGQ